MPRIEQNHVAEWSFTSSGGHADPFNEVSLDVLVETPGGRSLRVPAFWSGGNYWRVRYSSPETGTHRWCSECSDTSDSGLHDRSGELEVIPYKGNNPLYTHGALCTSDNKRHFTHADGTPFLWLGDTWWMGLCSRMGWPEDYQALVADRVGKGFSVIQIVAGLNPDMPSFDERGRNEAGFPWEEDYACINPAYFDLADMRIQHLVEKGLVPCILGCWGYYLLVMGVEKMKQHWRNLVARYGAYPVVWCMAGEGIMPYYLSEDREGDRDSQRKGWTEVASSVRATDPYDRLVTIHPTDAGRNQVEDPSVLDFDMLQTGHGDRASIPNTIRRVTEACARQPTMPVINGEVCYEGIGEACRQEVQRFMFWICMLSGACGHTYGANGIWQVNKTGAPYSPSPRGRSWGHTPWDEAAALPGSTQLGLAKQFLEKYPWWQIEPHTEWVDGHATDEKVFAPYSAGIPRSLRLIFLPSGIWGITVNLLEADVTYRAFLFDPVTGDETDLGAVEADASGSWTLPGVTPIFQDWVLVLEAT